MTGALGRGIHIPPMRLVEWPLQLVESPHFLKYVLEHVSAEDAALGWQAELERLCSGDADGLRACTTGGAC